MITLIENKLFAVPVPEKAKRFYEHKKFLGICFDKDDVENNKAISSFGNHGIVGIGCDFKILGTVTADEITFDVEPYVESELKSLGPIYMDYTLIDQEKTAAGDYMVYTDKRPYKFDEPVDSFYSLLQSKGIYFTNQIPMPTIENTFVPEDYKQRSQAYEDKLVKKVVILLKN